MAQKRRIIFVDIVNQIAKENNLNIVSLSDSWVIELSKENLKSRIIGYTFSINNAVSNRICDDKSATSQILENKFIPTVKHFLFQTYLGYGDPEQAYEMGKDLLKKHNKIVVKPNEGRSGLNTFLVESEDQLVYALDMILVSEKSICFSPFVNSKYEYRVVVLHGRAELIYQKQKVENEWRYNLSNGSSVQTDIPNYELILLEDLAIKASQAVGINFATVDILEDLEGNLQIMEVNSGVSLIHFLELRQDYFSTVKNIYKKAILSSLQ